MSVLKGPEDSEADVLSEANILGWTMNVDGKTDTSWVAGLFDDYIGSSETGMR